MKSYRTLAASVLCAGLTAACPAHADQYTLFDLGGANQYATFATGINDRGQVVGNFLDGGGFITGADGLGIRPLGSLSGAITSAAAINNRGEVAGTAREPGGPSHAFISTPGGGRLRDLGNVNPDPQRSSFGTDISDRGQVVGAYENVNFETNRPFITGTHGGAMRSIGSLGGFSQEMAFGVNNRGQVVGGNVGERDRTWRSFITDANGTNLRSLFSPEIQSTARDINDRGQVVGSFGGFFDSPQAFFLGRNGVEIPLGIPTAGDGSSGQYSNASAVNERGQVGGEYSLGSGSMAFITGPDGSNFSDVNSLSFINAPFTRDFTFNDFADINIEGQFVVNATNGHSYLISSVPDSAVAGGLAVDFLGGRTSLVSSVPEPATMGMLLAGLAWIGAAGRRRAARSLSDLGRRKREAAPARTVFAGFAGP